MMKSYFSSQPGTPWRRLALAALLSGSSLAAYAAGGAPAKHARPTVANDAAVTTIYTYGRLATPRALPHAVQAVITNAGTDFLTNLPVTLTVGGSNIYTNTQTVSVLAAGASTTVTFAPYPTSFGQGSNTVTVTVPSDDNNANNSAATVQRMTSGRVSYIDTTATLNTAGASVGSAGGVLAVKYTLLTSTTYLYGAVATFAAGSAGTYQVLVYDATGTGGTPGNVLYTSGVRSRTAAAGSVTVPLPSVQVGSSFFIGLKELDNPLAVATQNESPLRPGVFYTQASGGSWTAVTAQTRRALDVVVGPAPTCPAPTGITVSSNAATSAVVTFSGPTNGTQYTVVYVPAGTTPTGTSPSVSGTSPVTITGLTANTRYDVYVTTTCGTTGNSTQAGPVQVTTACRAYTFPYTENFDGVTAPNLPCGITTLNANNDTGIWATSTIGASSAPNSMRYNYSGVNAADDWFFTPGLPLIAGKSYQLQFKYRGYGSLTEAMEVKVGSSATPAGQTTSLFSNSNFNSSTYTTTTTGSGAGQVALFTPTTAGTYYFGFHAISPSNQWYIYVDDLVVSEINTPNCPAPTNVVVSNPTTVSATVTFTTSTSSTNYTLIYGPAGFTPGGTGSTSVSVTGSPYTLNSLNPNTRYDVYVQANCVAGGTSLNSAPASFATACATVSTFPYTETFDSVTAPALPCGVTVLDSNNDGTKWTNTSTSDANSSPNAMRYSWNTANAANDWFFMQAMNLQGGITYQLKFKYKSGSTTYVEAMEAKIGTAATAAGQTVVLFTNNSITNTSYTTTATGTASGQVAPFTPTTSGTYYIGFHCTSIADQLTLYVDDVEVTATGTVPCPSPTNIQVSAITATTATVSFTGPSNGVSYTVVYGPRGFNPATGGQTQTGTSPITITGLTNSTAYDVYVRATCSGTAGTSSLNGPALFTTACAPATLPYSEGFDQVTAPALACNISVLDANSDGSTWANTAEFPSSSPNAMRYTFNPTAAADDWFFAAGLPLAAGTSYQLQFKYRGRGASYPEKLEVKVGTAATAAGQTTTVFSNLNITNDIYATTTAGTGAGQVQSFTPTTTGTYYFGFHAISDAGQYYLYVDDVRVAQALGTKSSTAPGFSAAASPVPFGDRLSVTLSTLQAGPVQLTLHDALGRVMSESTTSVPTGASSLAVPGVGTLPTGIYLLTVRQGNNTQVIRVAHE